MCLVPCGGGGGAKGCAEYRGGFLSTVGHILSTMGDVQYGVRIS